MQRQLFLKHIAQTSDAPMMLEIANAEGVYLTDIQGKKYLDLISGIGVSCLGHRHPNVAKAIHNQVDQYWHTLVYGEFVLSPQVQLANLLAQNLPFKDTNVYFVNSGAEATEGAMKLAKRYTGRSEIVAMRNAYHGSTQGAMSLNSDDYFTRAYRPLLPDIRHIDFNDATNIDTITAHTAAVIVETVQAENGIRPPQHNYLQKLRKQCDDVGALLILDEIQTGYGRTGSLWAFEQYEVIPDVLLLAKGMGGGMPIGAFIAEKKVMQCLMHNPVLGHITTFGGHPVNCAAALATLQTLLDSDLINDVKNKEIIFKKYLMHSAIKEVRSAGLMLAVELGSFEKVLKTIKYCLEKGLITDWFLFNNTSLRIAPPLTINEDEIIWACKVIQDALDLN